MVKTDFDVNIEENSDSKAVKAIITAVKLYEKLLDTRKYAEKQLSVKANNISQFIVENGCATEVIYDDISRAEEARRIIRIIEYIFESVPNQNRDGEDIFRMLTCYVH